MALQTGQFLGNFRIVRLCGEGGSGDERPRRQVIDERYSYR
jgi:hypothetical protein